MPTRLLEAKPEIMERAAELQSQVAAMQEKLQVLLRGVGGLQVCQRSCETAPKWAV